MGPMRYCVKKGEDMKKALIFDVGGVLLDMRPLLDKFAEIFQPENKPDFWQYLNLQAVPLCRGDMSEMDFWRKVSEKFGKRLPDDELAALWTGDFEELTVVNEKMMDLVRALKGRYKLGIISNSIAAHGRSHAERGIFDPFDVVTLSHEVGMTKEGEGIFLKTADELGARPEECVFTDDVEQFVDTAESLGMKGLLFRGSERFRRDLNGLGIRA